jgi:hypothetical protein
MFCGGLGDVTTLRLDELKRLLAALNPWPSSGTCLAKRVQASISNAADDRVLSFETAIWHSAFALISPEGAPPLTIYFRRIPKETFDNAVVAAAAVAHPLGVAITTDWLTDVGSGEIHVWPVSVDPAT